MRHVYSALLYCLLPLLLLRLIWRSRREPAYGQRIPERFGRIAWTPAPERPVLWLHAVSVGEVRAAEPLIAALLHLQEQEQEQAPQQEQEHQQEHEPQHRQQQQPVHGGPAYRLLVTTTTPTGAQLLRERFGDSVEHRYLPWDLPAAVRRFLRTVQPRLLILLETELWPNLLHYSRASGARVLLVNARLSARSAQGYASLAPLTRGMLDALDAVVCQSEQDAARFCELGLAPARVSVSGSLKFDLQPDALAQASVARWRDVLGSRRRPVLVAGSTHAPEEDVVLAAFRALRAHWPDCLLVLAPRHPHRGDALARQVSDAGWRVARRSVGALPGPGDDVLLVDTIGELAVLYGAATVAFIGGSLYPPGGGHNPLEAAVWGVPVVSGAQLTNFSDIAAQLVDAGAMQLLRDPGELAAQLSALLADPARCARMGAAGRALAAAHTGATQLVLKRVEQALAMSRPFTGCADLARSE